MHKHLKSWGLVALSLSCLAAKAHADVDPAQMRNLENRVSSLEQRKGASGVINPSARPEVKNGADLFLLADLLIWQAHEDGLPLYIKNEGSSSDLSHSHVGSFDWNWNAGCRVGVGYNTPHDGWDLSAVWLHFNTDAHRQAHAHSDEVLQPTLTHPAEINPALGPQMGPGPFQKNHSHWGMNLNQIDLALGREYYVSKWLTLRPHIGLRTAWVHQHLNVKYNRLLSNGQFLAGADDHLHFHSNFWGLGLAAGLDTQWGLGGGWSIFGDAACGFLYGFHDLDRDDTVRFNTAFEWAGVDWSYRVSRAIADLAMGLRFDTWTNDERLHFRLQAGWEHHIYFNQNQFIRFVDNVAIGTFVNNQGDLTLQGWTLSARFDF